MKILKVAVTVSILLMLLLPTTVLASDVTFFNSVAYGIGGFTITYVTDTQLDLSWYYDAPVVNIMIRAKYGAYPADIPDENTAPSDGYLVYNGAGVTVSDTSMNFDQNPGILYYKAWGQKADGKWIVAPETGWKESRQVVLIALIILPLAIMGMGYGFKKSWILWLAVPFWFILGIYLAYNEFWFPDTAQKSLILIGVVGAIGCIFSATRKQLVPLSNPESSIDDEEMDDEDKEYFRESQRYQKGVGVYHTKKKQRRPRYMV